MAGSIPQTFIDELISRADIVELVDEYLPLKKLALALPHAVLFIRKKHLHSMSFPINNFFIVLAVVLAATSSSF